jgi:hypothetical protein
MLNKQVMLSGFEKSAKEAKQASDDARRQIKKLKSDVGQSLSHEQFQEEAKSIAEDKTGDLTEQVIDNYAQAIADYLNGMIDPTGDGPLKPFKKGDTKPIVEAFIQPNGEVLAVPPVDARVQAAWLALFPIQFSLNVPPPGSVKEVSAIAPPVPIGTMAPVISGEKSHDDMMKQLANVIDTAARQITVTIQHMIPSPSGPVPGPPVVGPVQ